MVALDKTSNQALLQACEREAQAAQLGKVFDEQAEFVWRTLRRLGVPSADVDDALQDVFIVVHRRLAEYQERSSLRSWLYAICLRVCSRHRRSLGRRREDVLAELPEVGIEPDQESGVSQQESLRLGQRLLEALPEKQRMVFVMYEVDHLTIPEIAEIVGCPVQTAYARLHKARERVRSELARKRVLGGFHMTDRRDPERLDTSDAAADAELKRALQALARERPHPQDMARMRRRLETAVSQPATRTPGARASLLRAAGALLGAAALGALIAGPRLLQSRSTPAATSGETAAGGTSEPARVAGPAPGPRQAEPAPGPNPAGPAPGEPPADVTAPERKERAQKPAHRKSAHPQVTPAERPGDAADPTSGTLPSPASQPAASAAAQSRTTQTAPVVEPPPTAANTPAPPAAPAAPAPLDEAGLLRRARQRASADPEAALRLLDEHRRRFTHGTLSPEREVLAIELLRALSRNAEADRRAADFRREHPDSIYLPRLSR